MRSEIIDKLNAHLVQGLRTEADVVYLLVQIRKLLEQQNEWAPFPTIQFYSNWVVHAQLDRVSGDSALVRVLRELEMTVSPGNRAKLSDTSALLSNALSMRTLAAELRTFLGAQRGFEPTSILKPEMMPRFVQLLVRILVDLPLIAPPSFTWIREFRLKLSRDTSHLAYVQLTLASGEVLEGPLVSTISD